MRCTTGEAASKRQMGEGRERLLYRHKRRKSLVPEADALGDGHQRGPEVLVIEATSACSRLSWLFRTAERS